MACDIGRRSAPAARQPLGLRLPGRSLQLRVRLVRALCTAAALAAALSAAALTASSRTAYASRRCVLVSLSGG